MNKKGKATGMGIFLVLAILVVIGLLGTGVYYGIVKQTQVQAPTPLPSDATQQAQTSALLNLGKSASLSVKAVDEQFQGTTKRNVGVNLYVWKSASPNSLIEKNKAMSSVAGTYTSITGLTVGEKISADAYNNSFYSRGVRDKLVSTENEVFDIPVDLISTNLKVRVSDSDTGGVTWSNDVIGSVNATIAQNAESDLDKLSIKNNGTDAVFNFGALAFDLDSNDNNVTIQSVPSLTRGTRLSRLKGARGQDIFVGLHPDLKGRAGIPDGYLLESQEIVFNSIKIKVDASATGKQLITIRVIDKQKFESVAGATAGSIQEGLEDDSTSETDVGAPDYATFGFNVVH